ncbi:hypothetical protein [Frankia sp. AgB32]|uniref:hypothetical protein n=1 Tax=Frankia sp. AgB32 TaxID=631119 RepID=UPI00200D8E64|nr:hypothetical protein [Frankia sp. AgB32]MCK9896947.1 hypothetical protein [Frankia sp. AgB32]
MEGAQTRDEAAGILSGLTVTQLRAFAAERGMTLVGSKKQGIVDSLVDQSMGSKASSKTTQHEERNLPDMPGGNRRKPDSVDNKSDEELPPPSMRLGNGDGNKIRILGIDVSALMEDLDPHSMPFDEWRKIAKQRSDAAIIEAEKERRDDYRDRVGEHNSAVERLVEKAPDDYFFKQDFNQPATKHPDGSITVDGHTFEAKDLAVAQMLTDKPATDAEIGRLLGIYGYEVNEYLDRSPIKAVTVSKFEQTGRSRFGSGLPTGVTRWRLALPVTINASSWDRRQQLRNQARALAALRANTDPMVTYASQ